MSECSCPDPNDEAHRAAQVLMEHRRQHPMTEDWKSLPAIPLSEYAKALTTKEEKMKKYRKKPIVIEAVQLTHDNQIEVGLWCNGVVVLNDGVIIHTMEGDMRANMGDWIIRGTRGEFYPCKPDPFTDTFEEV